MKKLLLFAVSIAFTGLPFCLKAQDEKLEKKDKVERKETQEIVIRNKGNKELNLKLTIKGDKITVNGKPLAEFSDDQVTINNRKMIIRDGDGKMAFNFGSDVLNFENDFRRQWKGKEMIKPFLGVTTEGVTEGAKVIELIKESAAEKAGLKKDDIITKVGDDVITDGVKLSDVIASKKPKEVVKVTYLRNGKEASVKTTLGEKKIKTPMAFAFNYPRAKVRSFSAPNPNIAYGNGNDDLEPLSQSVEGLGGAPYMQWDNSLSRQKKLGLKIQDTEEGGNVKVITVEEGSAAEKAGLKKDDIIMEIGGEKIENTDDAREQLMPSEEKPGYTIKAKRNGAEMIFEVKFPKKLKIANL